MSSELEPGAVPCLKKWVDPFSDFRHIDPDSFTDTDVAALKDVAAPVFNKLKKIVGKESDGIVRLGRVFEWTLWRATVLLNDINRALDDQELAAFQREGCQQPASQQAKYEQARNHYLAFLTDLDDHEPETKPGPVNVEDPKCRSAYGRAIKWVCIDPVIFEGRVAEARIIVKWNPHMSSSGIPVKH